MLRIVGIGGGTGLPVLLRGLKTIAESRRGGLRAEDLSISAIVCSSDSGGSSGRLREAFGIPAVGDLRNCLVALSGGSDWLGDLFQYRFPADRELQGHPLGNLIVTALCQKAGSLTEASKLAAELLEIRGSVLPATEADVTLCAELEDGSVVRGEARIP